MENAPVGNCPVSRKTIMRTTAIGQRSVDKGQYKRFMDKGQWTKDSDQMEVDKG